MPTDSEPAPIAAEEGPIPCQVCGAIMANSVELQAHLEGHAEHAAEGLPATPEGPSHHCAFCPAALATPEQLKRHQAEAHHK
jgi:hypothetical protein